MKKNLFIGRSLREEGCQMTITNLSYIKNWVLKNDVLKVEINRKDNVILALMRKTNMDYQIFIEEWLNGNLSTVEFEKFLEEHYWLVQYFYDDFLEEIKNV